MKVNFPFPLFFFSVYTLFAANRLNPFSLKYVQDHMVSEAIHHGGVGLWNILCGVHIQTQESKRCSNTNYTSTAELFSLPSVSESNDTKTVNGLSHHRLRPYLICCTLSLCLLPWSLLVDQKCVATDSAAQESHHQHPVYNEFTGTSPTL